MRFIAIVAACAALGATTFSQVGDGQSYTDGMGTTCTVDVVDTPGPGVTIQVTDQTGHTPATTGTAGSNSTPDDPTCQNAPAAETNSPEPNEYRVKNGKLQKKNKETGKWVNMRAAKKKKGLQQPPRLEATYVGPESTGSLPPERL